LQSVTSRLQQTSGIHFSSSRNNANVESFAEIPLDLYIITPLTDANWGYHQDKSVSNTNDPPIELDLFKPCSVLALSFGLVEPLTELVSSVPNNIMHCKKPRFVDECTKTLQQISTIFKDLKLFELYTITVLQSSITSMLTMCNGHTAGCLKNSDIFSKDNISCPLH
jgi:hypothetical protein